MSIGHGTSDAAARTDDFSFGDVLVRTGIADHAEVQVGWTAYGHETVLDRATRSRSHADGVGDVTLAVQRAFGGTDGPIAARAFITLPTGTGPLASGDWGGGVMIPLSIELSKSLEFDLTPEVDAAVDASGSGRHLAYGSAIGLGVKLSERLSLAVDATAFRDDDPDDAATKLTAGASLAQMIGKVTQVDVGTVVDFTTSDPGVEVYFGVARKF